MPKKPNETYTEEETAKRRDAALGHALSTPPKPLKETPKVEKKKPVKKK